MSPVAALGVTSTWMLTEEPCMIVVGLMLTRVVVLGVKVADAQFVTRLVTFTEPRPVAKSYPALLWYWALAVPKPASPGTALFPAVTSLKLQVLAGNVVLEPLHFLPAAISAAAKR